MNALQGNDFNQTVSTKTASYTLVAADAGTKIVMNSASATTITVNTSLFAAGDTLTILNIAAGVCTVTAGTATVSTTGTLALVANAGGTLYFTSAGVSVFLADGVKGIGQIVSATKTDTFTMASTTAADVTGLTVSITPTLATSKVLVIVNMVGSATPGSVAMFGFLLRDATNIARADAAGNRTRTSGFLQSTDAQSTAMMSISFLDSPATTSATTYKMQIAGNGASTVAVNRTVTDSDATAFGRTVSTITAMEVLV
jgi:hypothetical protein